jgi:hypothetical protein
MPSKNIYYVGTGGYANYSTLAEIPASILAAGDTTIAMGPGTYDPLTNAVLNNVSFVGQGVHDEIVINGNFTIANTSTGIITFENLTLAGTGTASAVTGAVQKLGIGSCPIFVRHCTITSGALGIVHHGTSAQAGTTKQVEVEYTDARATDRAIYANANIAVSFSALNNITANAYFTYGAGGVAIIGGANVTASTSTGSNVGNMTETIIAFIS